MGGHRALRGGSAQASILKLIVDLAGRLLHTLVGYTDRPTGAQLASYLGTIAVMVALTRFQARGRMGEPLEEN